VISLLLKPPAWLSSIPTSFSYVLSLEFYTDILSDTMLLVLRLSHLTNLQNSQLVSHHLRHHMRLPPVPLKGHTFQTPSSCNIIGHQENEAYFISHCNAFVLICKWRRHFDIRHFSSSCLSASIGTLHKWSTNYLVPFLSHRIFLLQCLYCLLFSYLSLQHTQPQNPPLSFRLRICTIMHYKFLFSRGGVGGYMCCKSAI
jgi:hypothetical protein